MLAGLGAAGLRLIINGLTLLNWAELGLGCD